MSDERLVKEIADIISYHHSDYSDVEVAKFILGRVRAHNAELVAALEGLVNRLDEINAHPEFKNVWTLHHVHGGRYAGPTWVEPLEAARAVLSEQPQ